MFGWRRKKNAKPMESVDAIAPFRVSPLDLGSPSPEPPFEPSVANAPDEPVAEGPGTSATSPLSEHVAPTAWEAVIRDPEPVVEAPPVATVAPEPPAVRYHADDAAAVASSDSPLPVLRFTPVDPATPAAEPEAEVDAGRTAEVEVVSRPPAAVRADDSGLVARPEANRAFAERMRVSQQEMAQLSMHMNAWMDQAAELRTELLVEWDTDGLRPSYTDFVVRAVARSLVLHPYLNSVLREGVLELLTDIHVGITTPRDDDVPLHVVSDADHRTLKDIAGESRRIETDHESLQFPLNDPTFVVTSLGAYGVDSFTPIVMAPNVATLGIGRVREETRWEGDRPVRASMMTLVLSWDHRAFGGAVAAEFLARVREMLEQPYRLLVD